MIRLNMETRYYRYKLYFEVTSELPERCGKVFLKPVKQKHIKWYMKLQHRQLTHAMYIKIL